MERFFILILIIIVILGLIVSVYSFSKVQNNTCPYCGAPIEYEGKIIRDGKTLYRYVCTEYFWHVIDFSVKLK